MAAPSDQDGAVRMPVRVDQTLHDAYVLWAKDDDRSLAAQVRMVLRDAIPVKYLNQVTAEST